MYGGKHVLLLILLSIGQYEGRSQSSPSNAMKKQVYSFASWDDPAGGGITTQGKDLRELAWAIEEAVRCHFAGTHSAATKLHFTLADNPVLAALAKAAA